MIKGRSHEFFGNCFILSGSVSDPQWGFDTEPDLDPALFSSGLQYANK